MKATIVSHRRSVASGSGSGSGSGKEHRGLQQELDEVAGNRTLLEAIPGLAGEGRVRSD
jgi:hypothetical protein